jgi:cytochrome c biogenesis factor
MQAIIFPYINVLWIGIIVMVLGSLLAAWNRLMLGKKNANSK